MYLYKNKLFVYGGAVGVKQFIFPFEQILKSTKIFQGNIIFR